MKSFWWEGYRYNGCGWDGCVTHDPEFWLWMVAIVLTVCCIIGVAGMPTSGSISNRSRPNK